MKRLSMRMMILLLVVLAVAGGGGYYYYWKWSKERAINRYPSVSSKPIELGKPIQPPEQGVELDKPEPRIR